LPSVFQLRSVVVLIPKQKQESSAASRAEVTFW
jgi:hypothetical protein